MFDFVPSWKTKVVFFVALYVSEIKYLHTANGKRYISKGSLSTLTPKDDHPVKDKKEWMSDKITLKTPVLDKSPALFFGIKEWELEL